MATEPTPSVQPTPSRWGSLRQHFQHNLSNLRQRRLNNHGGVWPRPQRTGTMSPAVASAVGSFVLVWIGTSVVTLSYQSVPGGGSYSNLAIALAFGTALTFGVLIAGPHGQLNPADTTARALRHGDRSGLKLILPALGGAIAASIAVRIGFGSHGLDDAHLGAALPTVSNGLTAGIVAILLAELVGSLLLALSGRIVDQFEISDPYVKLVSKAIISGIALAGCLFATLTISGGALNPARLLGPVIVMMFTGGSLGQALTGTVLNSFGYLVIYLAAQFAGACIGVGSKVASTTAPDIRPSVTPLRAPNS